MRLFQAIIALKRLIRTLNERSVLKKQSRRKYTTGRHVLREMIAKSENSRRDAMRGLKAEFLTNVKIASTERIAYFIDHYNSKDMSTILNKDHRKDNTIQKAAMKTDDFFRRLASTSPENFALVSNRLQKNLNVEGIIDRERKKSDVSSDMQDLIAKNFALMSTQADTARNQQQGQGLGGQGQQGQLMKKVNELKVEEYLPGVSLYFGATVALQAHHGGFLSYLDPTKIKASGYRILPQTKFLLLNSDDLTDVGIVKYGDAVWLQAGHYEVLGANYVSGPAKKHESRKLHPALINCFRENMFKAQQYGRWIILNRGNPTSSIGEHVLNLDKVILEQEWCFLASNSPYESSLSQTKDVDGIMKGTVDLTNLFNPGDECSWKLHIVSLGREAAAKDHERQKLAHDASEQVDKSKESRIESIKNMKRISASMHEMNVNEDFVQSKLAHKIDLNHANRNLANKFKTGLRHNFLQKPPSLKNLETIYGPSSPIPQYKEVALRLRKVNLGIPAKAPIKFMRLKNNLEKLNEKYWNNAQKILVDTKAISELPSAMEKFYEIDLEKKIRAAIVLQRIIRNFLRKKYSQYRAMREVDSSVTRKIENKINDRRKILITYSDTQHLVGAHMDGPNLLEKITIDDLFINYEDSEDSNALAYLQAVKMNKQAELQAFARGVSSSVSHPHMHTPSAKFSMLRTDAAVIMNINTHTSGSSLPDSSIDIDGGDNEEMQGIENTKFSRRRSTRLSTRVRPQTANAALSHQSVVPFNSNNNDISNNSMKEVKSTPNMQTIQSPFIHVQHPSSSPSPQQTNKDLTPNAGVARPKSGGGTRRVFQAEAAKRLVRTNDREYGLPLDVFCNPVPSKSLSTGMRFLQAMSSNPEIYSDVKVVRRKGSRPATSSRTR